MHKSLITQVECLESSSPHSKACHQIPFTARLTFAPYLAEALATPFQKSLHGYGASASSSQGLGSQGFSLWHAHVFLSFLIPEHLWAWSLTVPVSATAMSLPLPPPDDGLSSAELFGTVLQCNEEIELPCAEVGLPDLSCSRSLFLG